MVMQMNESPMSDFEVSQESPKSSNAVLIGGLAVVVAAAAAGGWYFLLGPGASSSADPAPVVTSSQNSVTEVPSDGATTTPNGGVTPSPSPTKSLQTYPAGAAVDPFAPLVVPNSSSGGSSSTGSASTGTTSTGSTSSGTTSGATTTGTTGTGTTGTGSSSSGSTSSSTLGRPSSPQRIRLNSVSGSTASISVDAKTYSVKTGSTFGTYYKLLAVSGSCSNILYGDITAQLCKGEYVTIR